MKARKSLEPPRGEKGKGKCDDVQQRWSFKVSTSGHSTSVGLFKRDSLQEVLYHLLMILLLKTLEGIIFGV